MSQHSVKPLAKRIAKKTGLSQAQMEYIAECIELDYKEQLINEGFVKFGFGTVYLEQHAPKRAFNVNTGKIHVTNSFITPRVSQGAKQKKEINQTRLSRISA